MTALSRLPLLAPALLLLASLAPAPADSNDKADAALKRLLDRLDDPKAGRERLRQDLLAFRREHPGTEAAVRAAGALSRLPSPLDALDPAKIPPLERFDAQPKELVAVVGEHRGRHGAAVAAVAYQPDGKRVVSAGSSLVRLWDPNTMRLKQVLGASSTVAGVAYTPDGTTLAAACADGNVTLWDAAKDPVPNPAVLHVSTSATYAVAFAPDGRLLATGGYDMEVRLWAGPWAPPPKEPKTSFGGHTKAVSCLAFAPNGKVLASGSADGDVRLWDVTGETSKELAVLKDHGKDGKGVLALAFDPTAKEQPLLATAGEDGKVRLWRLGLGRPKLQATLESKNGPVPALAFSADGHTLAYAEGDYSVHLLDLAAKRDRSVLKGHERAVTGLAFGPRDEKGPASRRLVSGSADWTARLWEDVSKNQAAQKTVTTGHLAHAYAAVFPPDGRTLATCSDDKTLRLWDVVGGAPHEKAVERLSGAAWALEYLPDGKRLALVGGVGAQLWDVEARKDVQTYKGHEGSVNCVAVSPDGKQLLTGSSDKTARLWGANTGNELRKFDGHQTGVNGVAFAPDGRKVASASGGYLYDDMGRIIVKDGRLQYLDPTVRVWDLAGGKGPQVFSGHTATVYSVAFLTDGTKLASGAADPSLRLWGLGGGGETSHFPTKGHVYSIACSPDGRFFATTGSDARVLVWDAAAEKVVHEWAVPETPGKVAFTGDSRHLSVTLATGVVYVLQLPPEKGP